MKALSPQSLGGSPCCFYIYVEDADGWFNRAVEEGAEVVMPMCDMFWGDRWGQVLDPFGHRWSIATHVNDPTPEEMKKAQEQWQKQQPTCAT